MIKNDYPDQDDELDCKIYDARQDGGKGDDQTREIDLGDHIAVVDQRATGIGDSLGEKPPWKQGGIVEDRVGKTFGRKVCDATKEKAKDDHLADGLDDCPGCPEQGLLVAHLQITP